MITNNTFLNFQGTLVVVGGERIGAMLSGDRKKATHMNFLYRFFDLFRSESRKKKFEQLYDELHQNSKKDDSLEKCRIFADIVKMAGKGGEEQCTVSLNNHDQMRFDIAGESIFSQDIDDISKKWVKMIFLQPSTSYPDSYKIRNDKFGLLYKKLCAIQPDDGRMKIYQDQSLNKLMFFSEMRDLADVDEKNEFSVSLQEGKIFFNIYGISIYTQPVNESYKTIIQDGCAFFSLSGKSADELEGFIEKTSRLRAKKIADYFKQHKEILDVKKNDARNQDKKFARAKYTGTHSKHRDRIYYFGTTEELPPVLYVPGKKPVEPKGGVSKLLFREDSRFLAFTPDFSGSSYFNDFNPENNNNHEELKTTKTIIRGWVVDDNLIVVRNAGEDLFDLLNKGSLFNINLFYDAAFDLKSLHKKNIYVTDIKIENMVFNKQKQKVFLIDADGVINEGKEYIDIIYSPNYTTYDLVNNWAREDPLTKEMVYDYSYLRTADEYAFLLSIIIIITNDFELQVEVNDSKVDIMHQVYPDTCSKKIYKHPGAMNPENKSLFESWISNNVKPKFHRIVEDLLTNPAEVAKNSPNREHLADMLSFPSKTE